MAGSGQGAAGRLPRRVTAEVVPGLPAVLTLRLALDAPPPAAPTLLAVSRSTGRTLPYDLQLVGSALEASVPLAALVDRLGLRHDTIDFSLRVPSADAAPPGLRVRTSESRFPRQRVQQDGAPVECEAYATVHGNLSLRIGAGTPPGLDAGLPGGRRPAPRPVRWAVQRWLAGVQRRTARGRARRTPLPPGQPRLYFVIRSVYGVGGTIRTVLTTANHLAERGYPVTIISLLRPRDKPVFRVHPAVRLVPLFDERSRRGSVAADVARGPLRALARRLLVGRLDRWESVLTHPREPAFGRSSLLTDLLLVRALQRLGPGIVLTTRPVLNVAAARYAAPHLRTLAQEHMNFSTHVESLREWMLPEYRALDLLTTLTQGDADDYRRALQGAPVEVRSIPNGLPGLPSDVADPAPHVVVAAGRLTRQKGFDLLLPAFAQVVAQFPDWTLRIYGDGRERDTLQAQIDRLGLSGAVRLMGASRTLLRDMATGSVYVMSSRFEGFPMVLLEAMSVGLPVVSFDCPTGPRDLVEPGRNGLLVPPEDVDALAAAIGQVVADEEQRRAMGRAARETAAQYVMDQLGRRWAGAIDDLSRRAGA